MTFWYGSRSGTLVKVIKKSQNSTNQGFSYYFCLMMEGFGPRFLLVTSGSGCGSEKPKNIWILRIRIYNTGKNRLGFEFLPKINILALGAGFPGELRVSHPATLHQEQRQRDLHPCGHHPAVPRSFQHLQKVCALELVKSAPCRSVCARLKTACEHV